jgi:hypothetical protein
MNLLRSLSRHQIQCLRALARGELVLVFDRESGAYTGRYQYFRPRSKLRGRELRLRGMSGNHQESSLIELLQRRLIVDDGGRLVLSPEAARWFGEAPPLPVPRRPVAMSRTRAARAQGAA